MMFERVLLITLFSGLVGAAPSRAATIELRQQGAAPGGQINVELGAQIDMNVVVDSEGDDITGYAIYIAFDAENFKPILRPASEGQEVPFQVGGFLDGISLINEVEILDEEVFLSFGLAASGSGEERQSANGVGVAASFSLEVLRRPVGNIATIRVEERGHDRVSTFLTAAEPGTEMRFTPPLGEAQVKVTGFRIMPLPDVVLIDGQPKVALELSEFIEQQGAEVIWSHSLLSEIPTVIDPETGRVTMTPQAGFTTATSGNRRMIFTALEVSEGLTAADTVNITVISPPRIRNFPEQVGFNEDSFNSNLDLDAFVVDLDDVGDALEWSQVGGPGDVMVTITGGGLITFTATADWFGEEEVVLRVVDSTDLADTVSTRVVVAPVNDPPTAVRPDPVYPVQGSDSVVVPLSELLADIDDDISELNLELSDASGISTEIQGDNLLITGLQVGRSVLDFTVRDMSQATASSRLVAVVLAEEGSIVPEIGKLAPVRLLGGQSRDLPLNQSVMDDSPASLLTWTAVADSGIAATVSDSVLTVSGAGVFIGTSQVSLTVVDPDGNPAVGSLTVQVLGPEDEKRPLISPPAKIGLVDGEPAELSLDALVDDPDHADAEITWSFEAPEGLAVEQDDMTRTLRVVGSNSSSGPISLRMIAADPTGLRDTVDVAVLPAATGGTPELRPFPDASLESEQDVVRVDLDDFAFDADDQESELSWSVQPLAGIEVAVDPVNHTLTIRRVESDEAPATETQLALFVTDTDGNVESGLMRIELPPIFELSTIPDVEFFAGESDTSLVLDDHVIGQSPSLTWETLPSQNFDVRIDTVDAVTHRVRLLPVPASFQGTETLRFTATDSTGRSRTAFVLVRVMGLGLTPQVSALPRQELREGETNTDIDLDDFVIDDDPPSAHVWTFSGQRTVGVSVDPQTHQLTLDAAEIEPGLEQIQFLVRDPAGNVGLAVMEVLLIRGGDPPVISSLPQLLLEAGGTEEQLGLDVFVSDGDTPDAEILWEVVAPAGVGARVEDRRLYVFVPAGESGTRDILLRARDPQGNLAEGTMQIGIQEDAVPPEIDLSVKRHPVFDDLLELVVTADEPLGQPPLLVVEGDTVEVADRGDNRYLATYQFPLQEGEHFIDVVATGTDDVGNQTTVEKTITLSWVRESGGSVSSEDLQVRLNVPSGGSGFGKLALLQQLDEEEAPPNDEGQPAYVADLTGVGQLEEPATINFFVGRPVADDLGILRWDEQAAAWEELPTRVDEDSGWLSAPVRELGIFRLGEISEEKRLDTSKLSNYPNPFTPDGMGETQIVYELTTPGLVELVLFNAVGQRVRILVDEFRDVGVWSAVWDGIDANGRRLGSGVYFYELNESGTRHRGALMLLH